MALPTVQPTTLGSSYGTALPQPKGYDDWLASIGQRAIDFGGDPRLRDSYQQYVSDFGRVPQYPDIGSVPSYNDWKANQPEGGSDEVTDITDYATSVRNFGTQPFGFGTPLTLAQHAQLAAQIDKLLPGAPADVRQLFLQLPQEAWLDPQLMSVINQTAESFAKNGFDPEQTNRTPLYQISRNGFGLPGQRPYSDLLQSVQNVGAANAGMLAVGGAGAALDAAGVGVLGLGDTAAVPAGAVGGGGASGVPFGTTIGGDAIGAAPYYAGADASAIGSGINPETGLPMNLGQEQLGIPGTDVASGSGPVGIDSTAPATGAAGVGAAAAGSGGSTAPVAGAAAGGTALSRFLDGSASAADIASVLGTVGATGLGIFGSLEQQKAANQLSSNLFAAGAPSRARFEASMTPGFDPASIPGYKGALDTASESILRKLSATGGNPYGNPGGLIEANKQIISGTALPAVQNYQGQNAAAGGLPSFASAAPSAATNAISAGGNVFNAIGSGISSLTNPQPNLADTLRLLGLGRGAASAA